ncbi:TPA: hypothetical protein ACHVHO_001784 [Streptococcus suis]
MAKFKLQPDEAMILQEIAVQHGFGLTSAYTDELYLTTRNIYCVNKGVFGNTKNIYCYPLNQLKKVSGRPQAIFGKKSNGTPSLEIYLLNGDNESFSFQSSNKSTIKKWIKEINKIFGNDIDDDEFDTSGTPIGELKDVFNDAMSELGINFKLGKNKSQKNNIQHEAKGKMNKKCISCSAPLMGYKGQMVHCKYCDTEQTL